MASPSSARFSTTASPIHSLTNQFISPISNRRISDTSISFTPTSSINPFSPAEIQRDASKLRAQSLPGSRHSSKPSSASSTPTKTKPDLLANTRRFLQFMSPYTSPHKTHIRSLTSTESPITKTNSPQPSSRTSTPSQSTSSPNSPSLKHRRNVSLNFSRSQQILLSPSLQKIHRFIHFSIKKSISSSALDDCLNQYLNDLSLHYVPDFHSCIQRHTQEANINTSETSESDLPNQPSTNGKSSPKKSEAVGFTLLMIYSPYIMNIEELVWPRWAESFESIYGYFLVSPLPSYIELRPSVQ
jgi:hypothetical protein